MVAFLKEQLTDSGVPALTALPESSLVLQQVHKAVAVLDGLLDEGVQLVVSRAALILLVYPCWFSPRSPRPRTRCCVRGEPAGGCTPASRKK